MIPYDLAKFGAGVNWRVIRDWLLGRRVSRLDEALAAAIERGIKHDDAMERWRLVGSGETRLACHDAASLAKLDPKIPPGAPPKHTT